MTRLPLDGYPVYVPLGTSAPDAYCEALELQMLLCADGGDARWRDRWENYTCTLGNIEGGNN